MRIRLATSALLLGPRRRYRPCCCDLRRCRSGAPIDCVTVVKDGITLREVKQRHRAAAYSIESPMVKS